MTLGVALLQREGPAVARHRRACAAGWAARSRTFTRISPTRARLRAGGRAALGRRRPRAAAREARRGKKPSERLLAMLALAVEADVDLERGVRALAADHREVAALVRAADDRHELILTTDLAAVYGIKGEEAQEFGRVLHALHVAAMSRPAEEAKTWGAGPARAITALLGSNFPIE